MCKKDYIVKVKYLTTFLIIILLYSSVFSQKLTIYVDEFPPFNYTQKEEIVGLSVDVVKGVLKNTKFEYTITSIPWARAYIMSQTDPNTLIFSILRIKNRENLFKWVGIVAPAAYSVYRLKSRDDIQVKLLDDLKKYEVGTVVKDVHEHYFTIKGFELNEFHRVAGKNAYVQNYKKLLRDRIDLLPMSDAVINFISKKEGDVLSKIIEKEYILSEMSTGNAYLAASLTTKDETVSEIKSALIAFKKTEEYKLILKKWGL